MRDIEIEEEAFDHQVLHHRLGALLRLIEAGGEGGVDLAAAVDAAGRDADAVGGEADVAGGGEGGEEVSLARRGETAGRAAAQLGAAGAPGGEVAEGWGPLPFTLPGSKLR
ncbi:hypothetical protein [Sphingomicrobium astaxanthinifaciens]|uniref:hypothetical protein n=1 Tax=Sphingomicrobium astaxanthinifaciens TaxID=1227949 RepID=UPI001FCB8AEC|nr:hypothetical protein [Sphingomicrobium astaxanthinifaciens]MCJ7421786.1 hypothetical protein [Sphingomicrobium astaxanthinifaciens]